MVEKVRNWFNGLTKEQVLKFLWHIFLVVLGTFILSFGSGVFLVPFLLLVEVSQELEYY